MKIAHCQRLLAVVAAVALVLSPARILIGQSAGTGTITGTVTDSTGAVVPNATVTVIDTDTAVTHTVSGTGAGTYNAPFLQPGHYEVIVGAPGMSKVDTKNLTLLVGQTLTVDASLPVGATATEVTVTGETL